MALFVCVSVDRDQIVQMVLSCRVFGLGLFEADGPAQAVSADLQEDLVGDVVVRGAEQLGEDLR